MPQKVIAKVVYTESDKRISWSADVFGTNKIPKNWIRVPIARVSSTFSYETLPAAKKNAKASLAAMGIAIRTSKG